MRLWRGVKIGAELVVLLEVLNGWQVEMGRRQGQANRALQNSVSAAYIL